MAEKRFEMKFPSRFRVWKRFASVDSIVTQKILCEFFQPNTFGFWPNEIARCDLRQLLFQDVLCFALIRCMRAFPVGFAIPVVFDPPN
jgi:hypothetical protein